MAVGALRRLVLGVVRVVAHADGAGMIAIRVYGPLFLGLMAGLALEALGLRIGVVRVVAHAGVADPLALRLYVPHNLFLYETIAVAVSAAHVVVVVVVVVVMAVVVVVLHCHDELGKIHISHAGTIIVCKQRRTRYEIWIAAKHTNRHFHVLEFHYVARSRITTTNPLVRVFHCCHCGVFRHLLHCIIIHASHGLLDTCRDTRWRPVVVAVVMAAVVVAAHVALHSVSLVLTVAVVAKPSAAIGQVLAAPAPAVVAAVVALVAFIVHLTHSLSPFFEFLGCAI